METKCMSFPNKHNGAGYVRFSRRGKTVYAHRWFYEQWHGEIPKGMEIDHICRNRACINPTHLRAVDHKTNMLNSKFAIYHTGRCSKGHQLKEGDIYRSPSGNSCKICRRINHRAWRAKKKEEQNAVLQTSKA